MSYSDDDKEIKIGEEDEVDFVDDPNSPLSDDPLLEDDDIVGPEDDLFDSEFSGSEDSEY